MMWRLAFWWHGWRYRRQARHAEIWAELEGARRPDPHPMTLTYGSMILDEERAIDGTLIPAGYWIFDPRECEQAPPFLPAPEVAHSGWWGQTAADLAPETLDAWGPRGPSASYEDWLAEGTDAGPGADLPPSSVTPGPIIELGPNAARVLARYERRHRERWCLSWDNEAVAA